MSQTKTCRKCKKTLAASAFYANKAVSDGLRSHCKRCMLDSQIAKHHATKGSPRTDHRDCARCGKSFPKSPGNRAQFCSDSCRFWAKVDATAGVDGCWVWMGAKHEKGYGAWGVGGKPVRASRFAFEQAHGQVPSGLLICHRCDTPSCCNPAHLFAGTPTDNTADMLAKGRHRTAPHRHKRAA